MTTITLPKDLEDWARAEVAAGRARSVDELVLDALAERRERIEDVGALIAHARAQAATGQKRAGADVVADLRARAAELRSRAEAGE